MIDRFDAVGTVLGLTTFPVKSMRGTETDEAFIGAHGLLGDRAFGLVDTVTGKVVSAKSVRLFPAVLKCRAAFVEPPRPAAELPPVAIFFPDGGTTSSDRPDVDAALSDFFGRSVTLARSAPADFTIDRYHPDLDGLDPAGRRDMVAVQRLGAALFADAGLPAPIPPGAFFDAFPLSLLTTSTLRQLTALRPASRFDARRFRMNVLVESREAGFVENDWPGRRISLGDAASVRVEMPGSRCVMPTLAQDGLPHDPGILRALVEHNRIPVGGLGRLPCAGVYGIVEEPGRVRVGDTVALAPPAP